LAMAPREGMIALVSNEIDLPWGGADWKSATCRPAVSARQALASEPQTAEPC
jgi:hypothetical protein